MMGSSGELAVLLRSGSSPLLLAVGQPDLVLPAWGNGSFATKVNEGQ